MIACNITRTERNNMQRKTHNLLLKMNRNQKAGCRERT